VGDAYRGSCVNSRRRLAVTLVALICGCALTVGTIAASAAAVPIAHGLRFAIEPAGAVVGHHITGTAYDPSGAPVTVEVVDGTGTLVTSSSALVTIALGANPGHATLGGTTSVHAAGGVATFSTLTLDKPGNGYTLRASSPSLDGTTSSRFDISSTSERCRQDVSCQTHLSTPASDFQVIANPDPSQPNAGTLSASVDVGTALQCQGYVALDPNWWEFVMSSANRSKTIVDTIKMPTRLSSTPAGTVNDAQVCFGAQSVFTTRSGMPATAGTLPDGTSGFIGLLPNCPASGPCVVSRQLIPDATNGIGFDIAVTISVPEGLAGDPWVHS
jgi:hypothetical protein